MVDYLTFGYFHKFWILILLPYCWWILPWVVGSAFLKRSQRQTTEYRPQNPSDNYKTLGMWFTLSLFLQFRVPKIPLFSEKIGKFSRNSKKNIGFFWKNRSWEECGICSFRNPEKIWFNLAKIQQNSGKICEILGKKQQKKSAIFNENFEIRERCKGVHCVDLGESFPTSIYLQNLAWIQPRTSPIIS